MAMMKRWGVLLLIAFVGFTGCQREITDDLGSPGGGPGGGGTPATLVKATLKLLVVDENGTMVTKAKVQAGTTIVYTNEFGVAELKDVMVPANKALVTVSYAGYFDAYRTFAVGTKECFGKVKLQKYQFAGTVQSSTGGIVDIGTEVKLTFPPNAFVNESDGSPYTGTATIYGSYLNPEATDFNEIMPGDLVAEDNGDQVLRSFGMVNVELKGGPAQKLKLKTGVKVTMEAVIPASLLSTSPATLPMWHFDTKSGVWKKEGTGIRQGTIYKGEVSHFTWWNYDAAYPRVYISGTVKDNKGSPIVNTRVNLHVNDPAVSINTYTNNEGYFRIPAPTNAVCTLSLYSSDCNIPFASFPVTTGTADINLGTIVASLFSQSRFNVFGMFQTCSSVPVQNGTLKVFALNNMFEGQISNGVADISFSFCRDSVDVLIVAHDAATQKSYTVSKRLYKDTPYDLGTLPVCGATATKFIRYIVDNQLYYIAGDAVDSMTSHYFNFTTPWVQVAHNNWSVPGVVTSKIYFNTDIGGYVTTLIISAYPNLSNMGGNFVLTNTFENYSSTPGAINKGTMRGKMFDTGINQWRIIDVTYSVGQQ